MIAWLRSRIGSHPRRVSSHHSATSRRQNGSADSPIGRSVGTAPQAIQPSASMWRTSEPTSAISASDTGTPSTVGPGFEREAHVAVATDVHAGLASTGGRARSTAGRSPARARSGRRRARQSTSAGSSRKTSGRAPRRRVAKQRSSAIEPGLDRLACTRRTRSVGIDPASHQRDPERERTDDLRLHARDRLGVPRGGVEEAEQTGVGLVR